MVCAALQSASHVVPHREGELTLQIPSYFHLEGRGTQLKVTTSAQTLLLFNVAKDTFPKDEAAARKMLATAGAQFVIENIQQNKIQALPGEI